MIKRKPELLAPVGNVESFYAALNAGADAIFLGLPEFNARGRASNFTRPMLQLALLKAREKNVKVYITLNILIKNKEIDQLLDVLAFLNSLKVNGIIIQDWGVYYIARKYFPALVLHASTQMGNHNSVGVNFGASKGIVRTVLARELTMPELEKNWRYLFMVRCVIRFQECAFTAVIREGRGQTVESASRAVGEFIRTV